MSIMFSKTSEDASRTRPAQPLRRRCRLRGVVRRPPAACCTTRRSIPLDRILVPDVQLAELLVRDHRLRIPVLVPVSAVWLPGLGKDALSPERRADVVECDSVGVLHERAPWADLGNDDEGVDARECSGLVFRSEGEVAVAGLKVESTSLACRARW